jgi:multidrug transporter EmrE-like cation transporter
VAGVLVGSYFTRSASVCDSLSSLPLQPRAASEETARKSAEETADLGRSSSPAAGGIAATLRQLGRTLANWRFSIPFLVNQSGSILNNFLLGSLEVSIVVPLVNSLGLVFTALTARLLGEAEPLTAGRLLGTALVLAGVALCLVGKQRDFVGEYLFPAVAAS